MLRASTRKLPSRHRFHGVDVEGVEGTVQGGPPRGVVGARQRHVVEEVPLAADQAGGEVDFLEQGVGDGRFARTADRAQVAADRVIDGDQGGVARRQLEFVQVGLVAVAGPNHGDLPVGAVRDHPSGRAAAAGHERILPPGEHRLAAVALHAQVAGPCSGRQRVEPDQPAVFVEDHRAVLALSRVGREEQVPAGLARAPRDGHRRRAQVRSRDEALVHPEPAGREGAPRAGARDVPDGDREAPRDRHRARALAGQQAGRDADGLAFGERPRGHEAGAVTL